MTKTKLIILIVNALTTSCKDSHNQQNENKITADTFQSDKVILTDKVENTSQTTEIICDSVYKGKGYKITLTTFDIENEDETKSNSVFTLSKWENGQYKIVYLDSICNRVPEIHFTDYNNDNIKDILIQNFFDVRSNWTYYLYLVDMANDKLKKIKGFKQIKNPNSLSEYNLIDNYVNSGTNWTSFYKIEGDTAIDLSIEIHDNQNEDGTYQKQYKKAINRILKDEKNSH
ncbi:hypothetical protein BH10BAC2_BH10BAC2_13430 [soil metagenome]